MRFFTFIIIFFFFLLNFSFSLSSQNKDYKKYDKALKLFNQKKLDKSKKLLNKILKKNIDWNSPNILLSKIYIEQNNIKKSVESLLNIYDENNSDDIDGLKSIINIYYQNGYYKEALYYVEKILNFENYQSDMSINLIKRNCIFSLNNINDSIKFNPINLGPNINTEHEEYLPALSIDSRIMVFTRRSRNINGIKQEDFYISKKDSNNIWGKSILFPGNINTTGNEGAFSFSPDKDLIVFTACNRVDGFGRCDLYFLKNNLIYNAGDKINTKFWESQASFSPDRRFLYFVSNRPGGYGGKDIWKAELKNYKVIGIENLGSNINTEFDEISPFIHPDNLTLYFSSNGHVGYGDFDLFFSTRSSTNDNWSSVQNLGYPLNTHNIENSLIVSFDGLTAYFTSDNLGFGSEDIYSFLLPERIQPNNVSDFEINILKNKVGNEIILKNVFFESNSSSLDTLSFIQLDKLSNYLNRNLNVSIEIQGHTDKVGKTSDNQILSEKRAKNVFNYLSKSVNVNQLSFKGYGELKPIRNNNTKFGIAINRRTSFIILD